MERLKGKEKEIMIIMMLVVLGALSFLPECRMAGVPQYPYEDTLFHFNRLLGLGNVWKSPVNFKPFGGLGTYVNIFYPWLTMYPMWLFYKLCGSYVLGYKIYFLFLAIVTILISYYVMKTITKHQAAAFCFAVIYTFSSYRFIDIYLRGALGEGIALTFLPIVLLGLYHILFGDYHKWHALMIGMTLIVYTHMLSLIMTAVVVFAFCVVSLPWVKDKGERIKAFIKAAFFSVLASIAVIAPMVQSALQDNLWVPDGAFELLVANADGLRVILINSIKNEATQHSIGLLVLLAFFASIIMFCLVRKRKSEENITIACLFLLFGFLLVLCTSAVFPWKWLGQLPAMNIIQFPWRLNGYVILFFSAAFALLLPYFLEGKGKAVVVAVPVAVSIIAVVLSWTLFSTLMSTKDETFLITDEILAEMNYNRYIDYYPKQVRNTSFFAENDRSLESNYLDGQKVSYYLDGKEIVPDTETTEDGNKIIVRLGGSSKEQSLDIPVYCFSTLEVVDNGANIQTDMTESGTTLVTLPAADNHVIELYHHHRPLTYLSWAVSILTVIGLGVFYYLRKRGAIGQRDA